ncbi:MAG: helix-turn-helix transcriptional regulator [Oscillospiraceae bacterium]|nr:helix-turn-helix transcriptional regulator [Oscillospiraceae bacterium]
MRDIGKNIKALREAKNLTQEEFAQLLFVTRQTVSNYETGKTRPDVDMILKIAQVLDTDANTVFYGTPVPEEKILARRKLVIGTILLGILFAGFVLLLPVEIRLQQRYILTLSLFLHGLLSPVMALLFGWLLLQGLSLVLKFKRLQKPWAKYIRYAIMAALCVLLVFTLFVLLPSVAGLNVSGIPLWLSSCCYGVLILNTKATASYVLLGAALWIFGAD